MSVTLSASGPPVPLVGSPVIWTAAASGDGTSPVYQFSVGQAGGVSHVVRDFSPTSSFTWNPLQEGTYHIQVVVKASYGASTADPGSAKYTAQTRIVGNSAVITPMANPLVALYSAPPSSGATMYVQFAQQSTSPVWQSTSSQAIVPGESTNFIVAGMLPNTTYLMRHVLADGTTSTPITFTTGSLPAGLTFPTFTEQLPPTAGADPSQNMVFHAAVANQYTTMHNVTTLATDLNGNVIWYYDPLASNFPGYSTSLAPGGRVMMLGGTAVGVAGGFDTVRVADLAGDTLHETNISAVNAELAAMGQPSIIDFDHEVKLLPNGDTAVLASTQKKVLYKGHRTKFTGDMVLVLDQNFQVSWVWNSFNWLKTSRLGTDGEGPGDWLHGNSVSWSPADGNLIVFLRAQDWVIKIDYSNGTGDGHVVWKLGKGGNFDLRGTGPDSWFSHQHDVSYINDTTIVLFDDGNTRHKSNHNAHSRGQELVLNEQTMKATLVVNADLGNYSAFLGSAQLLPNGNLAFTSGGQGSNGNLFGQTIEVLPDGTQTYVQKMKGYEYRSYLESSLYS